MACDTAPEKDARIFFTAYDKNISWSDGRVVGSTHGHREWNARRTLLTILFGVLRSHHHTPSVPHNFSKQQTAQVGDHQNARHFTSWHNMRNPTRIPDSNTLFTLLGKLVTTGVVLLPGCCVRSWSRNQKQNCTPWATFEVLGINAISG